MILQSARNCYVPRMNNILGQVKKRRPDVEAEVPIGDIVDLIKQGLLLLNSTVWDFASNLAMKLSVSALP